MEKHEIEDRVILDLPIITKYGEFKPLSILEYMKLISSIAAVSYSKKKLLALLGKAEQEATGKTDSEIFSMLKELNEVPMKELMSEYFSDYLVHYIVLLKATRFHHLVSEDEDEENGMSEEAIITEIVEFINSLTNEDFDEVRNILLSLHNQTDVEGFLNPPLQRSRDKKNSLFKNDSDSPNLVTMISSCVAYSGITYKEVAQWNAFQLHHTFQRIAYLINNEATTLFRTVSDEVDFVNWAENIDSENNKEKPMTYNEFAKNTGLKTKP